MPICAIWQWPEAETVTAIATIGLAGFTGWLAFTTRRVAGETRDLAGGAIRPLMLPLNPPGTPRDRDRKLEPELIWRSRGHDPAAGDFIVTGGFVGVDFIDDRDNNFVAVVLVNLGEGMAVISDPLAAIGTRPVGAADEVGWSGTAVGFVTDDYVAEDATARASFHLPVRGTEMGDFVVEISYTDIVGRQLSRTRLWYRQTSPGGRQVNGFALYDGTSVEPRAQSTNWPAWANHALP